MSFRFSIIIPTFQHRAFLEEALHSVLEQEYPTFEIIVIDGGSRDGTTELLHAYQAANPGRVYWRSEPDRGQADAINKGMRLATGDIVGWLNADDRFAPGALAAVQEFFVRNPQADFVYGDALALNREGRAFGVRQHVSRRQRIPGSDHELLVRYYDFIVQPAAFWRASLWQRLGELDSTLVYALDYEYWMRAAAVTRLCYLPRVLAHERLYAAAKTGSGGLARIAEIEQVAVHHGGDGLPRFYRAEGAALHIAAATERVRIGDWEAARAHLHAARRLRPRLGGLLRYGVFFALFGPKALPTGWLWMNRLRTGLFRRYSHTANTSKNARPG